MKRRHVVCLFFFALPLFAQARGVQDLSLTELQRVLVGKRFVDLTHAFGPGIPHWPGFLDEKREMIYWYDKGRGTLGDGFFAETFTHVGQWGTHVDPPAHFVRTDWSKRWSNAPAMQNKDAKNVSHYPGWSLPALKYLYEERKITASGHETTDTDPGIATTKEDYSLEMYILRHDHYQIELLTNLDQLPESGAIIVATFPKAKAARVFPARVFAIADN